MKVHYLIFMAFLSITSHSFAQEVTDQNIPFSEESSIIPEGGPESELVDLSNDQLPDGGIEEQEELYNPDLDDVDVDNEVITEEMQ